ncbi:hypothetical protein ISCGN_022629 [Ixodes scapularis]
MSKLVKLQVRKKLGAQWICVRHCLELPQIHFCSHCTLVQPLQDKRPQLPKLHPPPITMDSKKSRPSGFWYICRTVVAYSPSVFLDFNSVQIALHCFLLILKLGSRGTPQGAVLSPLLFNLALRGLPEALRAVPNVEHAIYADDITLWCREGSDAEIEEKLQAAADIVGEYVMRCGLKCAPEKSELLVFRNPRDKLVDHIDVVIDGVRVPKPAEVRILGQLLQQGRGNKSTIDRLDAMTTQVCGMMRRIRNRRHGIKEKEAIQLVQAFIIARLTYGTPYLNLNKAEMQKLNVLIRRAYKNALGLPERTATEKLLKLGVHNTIEELHEAQLVSQLKRLSSTVNGVWLLDKLGMAVPGGSHGPGDAGEELPAETRQRFTISRIPRNMHPDRNAERRQARAVALARSWDSREGTLYVDGAGPVLGVAAIVVASAQGQIRRVASIRAQTVEQVEEAAIALAVVCNPRATIISDSQRACQNFARGVVGQPALRLLRKTAVEGVHLIWTPGHMGQVGNEAANAAARGALYRDSVLLQRDLDSALTYSEALKALRTHRAEYPGPAKGLSKEEEFTWRRLQTDTFVTPIQLHLWYPERERQTLNYGNEKRRPFVNVERRMLNYDNVKQRRFENVEQQNLRFGTVKFNVNVQSERRNPTFENGKPCWFVNVEQQNLRFGTVKFNNVAKIKMVSLKANKLANPNTELANIRSASPRDLSTEEDIHVYGYGQFQRMALLCSIVSFFMNVVHSQTLLVMSRPVAHWCEPPDEYAGLSADEWKNTSIPKDEDGRFSSCTRYEPPMPTPTDNKPEVSCDRWDYEREVGATIVTDFSLVCDRKWLLWALRFVYLLGGSVLLHVMGSAADNYGRRAVLVLTLLGLVVSGVITSLVKTRLEFAVLHLLTSASITTFQIGDGVRGSVSR